MRKFFYIISIFLVSLTCFQSVLAVGVSPGIIELQDLANNMVVDKLVYLSRANPAQDEYYKVTVYGEGAPYIQLSSDMLKLPKGQQQVPYTFQIKPVAAANGTYKANISFDGTTITEETASGGNGVALLAGVTALVKFTILDKEVKKIEVLDIYNQETEVDQPYVFFFQLKNSGNVNAKPDRISLTFVDRSDPNHIISETIEGDKIAFVEPQKTDKVIIKSESKLPEGKYDLKIDIYLDNQVIFSKSFFTHILPKGTLQQKIEFEDFQLSKTNLRPGETLRFSGKAKNGGEVAIEPIFVVEISKDGQVLDVKRSDKQLILKNESLSYPLSFVADEKGNYLAKAWFEYGVRKTEPKEMSFVVSVDYTLYYILGGSGVLLLLIIIIFVVRRSKKNKNGQPPQVPPAPSNTQTPPSAPVAVPPNTSVPTNAIPSAPENQPVQNPASQISKNS